MNRGRRHAAATADRSRPYRLDPVGGVHRLTWPTLLASIALLSSLSSASVVFAAPGAFTDSATFQAAVAGGTASVDFETLANGTDVSGTTQTASGVGVTLPGPVVDVLDATTPPLPLRIVADAVNNPALSGTKSLGVEDPKNFNAITAGTPLTFTFPEPVVAFGLTIITPEEPGLALFDTDLLLTVPGEATASLTLSDAQTLGTFGGRVYRAYFLGVVGGAPFSTASLDVGGATPTSGFLFNVDDLLIPVPEPSVAIATLAGGSLLSMLRRRRDSRSDPRRSSRTPKGLSC